MKGENHYKECQSFQDEKCCICAVVRNGRTHEQLVQDSVEEGKKIGRAEILEIFLYELDNTIYRIDTNVGRYRFKEELKKKVIQTK